MNKFALLFVCGLVSSTASRAANIHWVSFHSADNMPSGNAAAAGFTQAPDIGYTQLLQANGHTVTRVVTSGMPDVNVLNAADLVIISRSVPSADYETDSETAAWNGITAPTIILGGYILRNNRLGYTTGTGIPDTAGTVSLRALVPGHPIFAGIDLDANRIMVNPYANIVSYNNNPQRGISVNTNPVAGAGLVLATIGTAGDPAVDGMVIGEWLPGATMATSPADTLGGHRLVLLTGSREANGLTSEAAGIYDLMPDGAQLLLNAVNYMTSGRTSLITVNTVNNENPGPNETSLLEALTDLQDGDYVRFNIPGAGPHVIQTPMGGYPPITADNVTIDGYTQPGAAPNTRGILEGNNAVLRIVLDSSPTNTAPNPLDPGLPLHHSTRLLYPGFGDTEDAILPVVGARNFTAKGLSFVSRYARDASDDPNVYCVAFVNVPQAATGGWVNGCWFGLRPDGSSWAGGRASVATFRNDVQETARNLVIGTDGDGFNDRAEFNIHAAMSLAIHLQVSDVRVSGNYVNVLPSGTNFVDVDAVAQAIAAVEDPENPAPSPATVEFYENANCTNVLIGTDGNGVADADERNIVANVSYSETMEFWREAANVVVAGNFFGVGVDGVTPSPVSAYRQPDFVRMSRIPSSIRIGSNGDGISDGLEANLIVNVSGDRFVAPGDGSSGDITEIAVRRNTIRNCGFPAMPFADSGTLYSGYYLDVVVDSMAVSPVASKLTNGVLVGTMAAPNAANYPNAIIDVYTVDAPSLANTNGVWPFPRTLPGNWLGSFTDNGPGDLDPAATQFALDLTPFALSNSDFVAVAVTYSKDANAFNAGLAVTSPMSNPINERPILQFIRSAPDQLLFWWFAPPGSYLLQVNPTFDPNNWLEILETEHYGGRNIVTQTLFFNELTQFFRLVSQ